MRTNLVENRESVRPITVTTNYLELSDFGEGFDDSLKIELKNLPICLDEVCEYIIETPLSHLRHFQFGLGPNWKINIPGNHRGELDLSEKSRAQYASLPVAR